MRIARLVAAAGSICDAARAADDTLAATQGIGRRLAATIVRPARRRRCRRGVPAGGGGRRARHAWADPDYPARLRGLRDAPSVVYLRGGRDVPAAPAVAIVGTRSPSAYGSDVARGLAAALAAEGVTVISSLARGIDRATHEGAVRAGGRTVGVLGCGVDRVYPAEHATLMEAICARGGVLSEAPMGPPPERQRFPLRNRPISRLAQAVVVVEGGVDSGSLITARHATAQGRDVYAGPGRVFAAQSRGPHQLPAQGAAVLRHPADLLDRLSVSRSPAEPHREAGADGLGDDETRVWNAVEDVPAPIDSIIARTALPPARVAAALGALEARGLVRQCAGNRFARRSTFERAGAQETGGGDSWPSHSLS